MNKIEKYAPTKQDYSDAQASMKPTQRLLSNCRSHMLDSFASNKPRNDIEADLHKIVNKFKKNQKKKGSIENRDFYWDNIDGFSLKQYLNKNYYTKLKEDIKSQGLSSDSLMLITEGSYDHDDFGEHNNVITADSFLNNSYDADYNWDWVYIEDAEYIGKKPENNQELGELVQKIIKSENGATILNRFLINYPENILQIKQNNNIIDKLLNDGSLLREITDEDGYWNYEFYTKEQYLNLLEETIKQKEREIEEYKDTIEKINNIK